MSETRKGIPLTEEQRLYWLQLIRSENIGAASFWALIKNYNSAKNALEALPYLAQKGGKKSIKIAPLEDVKREFEAARRLKIEFVCAGEPDYPPLLRQMDCVPPVLAIKGNLSLFQKTGVAIVGSRNASAPGIKLAQNFAYQLGQAGFPIISGFARGIDTAAHKASLSTGTIAVVAGGIDCIYPPQNAALYEALLDHGGAFISEMPLHFEPRAIDFPRRNRLIAGLCLGLLVVEAAQKSGSLITARLANNSGRHIFAIPGSPLDPRAQGTNDLIKAGANLVTEAQDIIDILTPLNPEPANEQLNFFESAPLPYMPPPKHYDTENNFEDITDQDRERILSALSTTPIDLETLCHYSEVSLSQLYLALVELDLAGRIIRHTNGLVSLRP